jgi:hypothetical protein
MSSAQIFTSNFARVGNDPGALAICRRPPRWYRGEINLDFAPTSKMLKDVRAGGSPQDFDDAYAEIMKANGATEFVVDLMSKDDDRYLLCFEGVGKRCHRTQFAEFVYDEAGLYVPEFNGNLTTKTRREHVAEPEPTLDGNVVTDTTGQTWNVGDDGTLSRQTEMLDDWNKLSPPADH